MLNLPTLTHQDPKEVLNKVFGYANFRDQQQHIIDHLLGGGDALVIMPTGGGKSICYQIPAIVLEGVTVVVSPLIALMNDQVVGLRQIGVNAYAIHSNLSDDQYREVINQVESGDLKLLYVSPERMRNQSFLRLLKNLKLSLIAIDEAHCVSVWGNDFRPDYAALYFLKDAFPRVPMVALTATADAATQTDIIEQLQLQSPGRYLSSFERENIVISVRPGYDRKGQIISFIQNHYDQSGIIYCLSRKSCEKMSSDLLQLGFKADHYHAGMDAESRNKVQTQFQNDEIKIVCATIAFGMGIDKSNIRWVVHFNMPKNLEGYYQEIGRSGRDGSPAEALLFYSWGDFLKLKSFIDGSSAKEEFKTVQYAKLDRMLEFSSSSACRTNLLLGYFGEYKTEPCGHCDNCLYPPEVFDGSVMVQKAISAIIRSGEKLTINLLIDVLRGSYRREITSRGLDQLKTFGVGRDLSFKHWRNYITQMLDKGLLRIDYVDGFKLKLTPLSMDAVKGLTQVELCKFVEQGVVQSKKRKKTVSVKELFANGLHEELRSWRKKMADTRGVPIYVVLTDRTIEMITDEIPLTFAELSNVEGMGQKRMEDYGKELLNVVRNYVLDQKFKKKVKGMSLIQTLKLKEDGLHPKAISEQRGISVSTVYNHLIRLFLSGEEINLKEYVTEDEIKAVENAIIDADGDTAVPMIAERLMISISFDKIRIATAILQKNAVPG